MPDRPCAALSIAIPTYRREKVLLDTIEYLLALPTPASEILVLDQTEQHEQSTARTLSTMEKDGRIRWIRLPEPSIPKAMNAGLLRAAYPLVLFVDDDVRPEPELVSAHMAAHAVHPDGLVAGRVIQPWQEGEAAAAIGDFACTSPGQVDEFIGCNFSVQTSLALRLGGFDENFVRVAYRFEAEFAHRYRSLGLNIHFEPQACVHHLKVSAGGTRSYGEHFETWRPDHAVGAYYFGLRTGKLGNFVSRPFHAITTRYHLRRPWRIPATLLAELSGMLWAAKLYLKGPRLAGQSLMDDDR